MAETTSVDDLPEPLLVHILSFLPTIDAVRASFISRKWRNLWHHTPTLNFDMTLHGTTLTRLSQYRGYFADFISQALFLRPGSTPFRNFHLHYDYRHSSLRQFQVDTWIRHAIQSGVKTLQLDFSYVVMLPSHHTDIDIDKDLPDEAFESYGFHFGVLRGSSSVRVLKLAYCSIIMPRTSVMFGSIRSVTLRDLSVTEDDLHALVPSLVNLEYLCLAGLESVVHFRIYSRKLKELEMETCMHALDGPTVRSFEICCPSLVKISFTDFYVEEYCIKDLSSLVEARVGFFWINKRVFMCCWELMHFLSRSCVERLITHNGGFSRDCWLEFFDVEDLSGCAAFKNLKHLELRTLYKEEDVVAIAAFLELCPTIELLVLDSCHKDDDKVSEGFISSPLVIHMPNLKQVKMKNYKGSEMEMHLAKLLKLHQVVLREILAFPPRENGILPPPIVL